MFFLLAFIVILNSINAQIQSFVGQGSFQQQQYCPVQSQQAIRQCAQEMRALGVFTQNQDEIDALTWEQIRRRSRQYFQTICDSYRRFSQCIGPYKLQCWYQEPIKGEFSMASETLEYICGEGFYSMLNNWDCYVQVSARQDIVTCEATLVADLRRQNNGLGSAGFNSVATMRDDNTCKRLQDYMYCIKWPIIAQCGQQSWEAVREAVQRPVRVYMPECILAANSSLPSILLLTVLSLCSIIRWQV